MHLLYRTMAKLKKAMLHFSLSSQRDDVITISIVVPGERIEVDVFDDERVDVARFQGSELESTDPDLIDQIIASFRDSTARKPTVVSAMFAQAAHAKSNRLPP